MKINCSYLTHVNISDLLMTVEIFKILAKPNIPGHFICKAGTDDWLVAYTENPKKTFK